jgi:hypothetical protein
MENPEQLNPTIKVSLWIVVEPMTRIKVTVDERLAT